MSDTNQEQLTDDTAHSNSNLGRDVFAPRRNLEAGSRSTAAGAQRPLAEADPSDPRSATPSHISPFAQAQLNAETTTKNNDNQLQRPSAAARWQNAGKKVTEKGRIRFTEDDTEASRQPQDAAPNLQRPSMTSQMQSSLSKISSTLNFGRLVSNKDNKEGADMAEVVKAAQAQTRQHLDSAAPAMRAVPSTKVMTAKKRHQIETGLFIPRGIIHPYDLYYRWWVFLTVIAAAWTGIYIPFALAFQHVPGLYPYNDGNAVFNYIFMVLFFTDSCLSFRVAIIENDILVTDTKAIAKDYLRVRFWVDFMAWFPFDWIVLWIEDPSISDNFHRWLGLLTLLRMRDKRLWKLLVQWFVAKDKWYKLGLGPLGDVYTKLPLVAFRGSRYDAKRLRMYRVVWFYRWCEYSSNIRLLWLTLFRNMSYALLVAHWAACIFYFIARQDNFTVTTWVGNNGSLFEGKASMIRYIWSLYWSITTLATVGYGDLHAYGPIEAGFILIYMLFGIILNAYILGTITLLIIKHDEQTGNFRDQSGILQAYSKLNNLPMSVGPLLAPRTINDLTEAMNAHLRLHFVNDELADQNVLSIYPSTLRRRALRHLYMKCAQGCYLFAGCRQKLLDSLLGASTVQLFMPKVEVVSEGDHVQELYVVLAGLMESFKPGLGETADDIAVTVGPDVEGSMHGTTSRKFLTVGDCFGEVAFFTEVPQMQTVRTVTVCRVLVVPRSAYHSIKAAFPLGTRQMLDNLQAHAEAVVEDEFRNNPAAAGMHEGLDGLALAWASPESEEGIPIQSQDTNGHQQPGQRALCPSHVALGLDLRQMSIDPHHEAQQPYAVGDPYNVPARQGLARMSIMQQQVLGDLLRVRTLVRQHTARHDENRTQEYLYAAARGDASQIQQMLQQGFPPDSSDYDQRTGLMLAALRGHKEVVELLIAAGAPVDQKDTFGQTALSEACKNSQDDMINLLKAAGANLNDTHSSMAEHLCQCIFTGDMALMRRYIKAGVDINMGDYDQRTPLHIAAAEINLPAIKMLVSEAKADVLMTDRWGATALDEVEKVGASRCVSYLKPVTEAARARRQLLEEAEDAILHGD